jgi:drug/metabolite transporter (DMT)-like permease
MGSFTYNGIRFALGAVSLIPVILVFESSGCARGKNRHTFIAGLIGGVVLFIASNLQQFGIMLNKEPGSASEAGFITGMYLIFTPILARLAFKRKVSPLTWLACVIAFIGLTLISGVTSVRISDSLLLLGAVFWAVHILLIDRYAHSVNPLRFTAVQFIVSSVLSMISAFCFETVSFEGIFGGVFPLLFGGLFACGTAYTLQILGQRGVEPSKAAIIFSLEALFACISEAVWLGEFMTARKYLGGMIIFAGILLSQIAPKNNRENPV